MTAIPAPVPAAAPAVADLDALFRGFADETRLRILNLLAAGELCVCDIVEILGLPQSTVSRHLAYLRRARLVEATREWRFAHYRLAEPGHPVHGNLVSCVRSCFAGISSLDRERAIAARRARERENDPYDRVGAQSSPPDSGALPVHAELGPEPGRLPQRE